MAKLSIAKFKEALKGSGGVQAVIAKRCNVERSAITQYLAKNPKLKILLEQERERIIDIAENKLHGLINKEEFPAIKYFLSTKGKKRGYIEKTEVALEGNITNLTKEEREAEIKRLLEK